MGRYIYLFVNSMAVTFLLAPIAVVFIFAVNPTPYISFPPTGFSLIWFEKLFASNTLMEALLLSLQLALISSALSLVLGCSAAFGLARSRLPKAQSICALLLSPLLLPALLSGLALLHLSSLMGLGRSFWILVIGHTIIGIPYVTRTTLATLYDFDMRLEEAARSLGASPLKVFVEVTFPLMKSGPIAGGTFAFIVSFHHFPISLFLAGPGNETLPIALFNHLRFSIDGTIAAASVVSITISFVVMLVLDQTVGLKSYVRS